MLKSCWKPFVLIALLSTTPTVLGAVDTESDNTEQANKIETDGYIKDDLFIYMHTGAGKKFRILGSINAGTAVQLLESDDESGYLQIKDAKGRIGWIERSTFSTEAGAPVKLQRLQAQYDDLAAASQNDQSLAADLTLKLQGVQRTADDLTEKVMILERQKTRLQDQLGKDTDEKEQNKMLYGAGICVGGLLLGLLIPVLVPRRRRKDNWG
jgi:SH3 domain protein